MNKTQVATILTPIIAAIATWLASKFPLLDQATWNTLLTAVFGAVSLAAIGWFTKTTSIADTIAPAGGTTTIVTTPEVANALPANPNVVSNTTNTVTPTR